MPFVTLDNITQVAMDRWTKTHDPRLRQVMTALIKHAHALVREVKPTEEEWLAACNFLAQSARFCDDKRQEFIMLSDVLGISMLVVQLNDNKAPGTTPNTVLGPFHIDGSPELPPGGDMSEGVAGEACYVAGTVRDRAGKPLEGVTLDVWQADDAGLYETQIPGQEDPRLRAIYKTGPDGTYSIRTVVPLGYTIPMDGTVGELMHRTDISHFRPAHIHFLITAPGYLPVITHIFKDGDPYIETDVVFGVKRDLITQFRRVESGRTPSGEVSSSPFAVVNFDFCLEKAA